MEGRDKVMHSLFEGDGIRFYASDGPDSEPMKGGALMIELDNAGAGVALFDCMSDGGRVTVPIKKQFLGRRLRQFYRPIRRAMGDHRAGQSLTERADGRR
jgi:uncharacterized glyoxalase superfamily protein PhnB